MEIQIPTQELEKAVQSVNKVVGKKTINLALSGILITANDNQVQFTGTDYETTIRYTIAADVVEPGKVLVSGQLFNDLVRQMTDADVMLKTIEGKNMLTVKSGRAKYDILLMDAGLYPEITTLDGEETVKIKSSVLQDIYRKTAFAVSTETVRPIFTGINFSFNDGLLTAAGTDTHRMSQKKVPVIGSLHDFAISVRSFSNLLGLVKENEEVEVFYNSGKVVFQTNNLYCQAQTLSGIFPDTERVVPKELSLHVVVKRNELLQALNRISVISFYRQDKIAINDVILSFTSNSIRLQGKTANKGFAMEEIPAEVTGEPIEIYLNGTQIVDCLKALDGEDVNLNFNTGRSPGLITDDDDDQFLHVICPLTRLAG